VNNGSFEKGPIIREKIIVFRFILQLIYLVYYPSKPALPPAATSVIQVFNKKVL
jgi:hypothetical protein